MTSGGPDGRPAIWVVSEMYYPEETSTGYFLTQIAEGLGRTFRVRAMCGQPTHAARGIRAPYRETHNGVDVVRAPGTTLNKDVLPFRVLNMTSVSLSIFLHLVFEVKRRDVVLVVTTPPLLPFIARAAAWIRRAACVLLVHDVYPENMIAAGYLKRDSVGARVFGWASRHLYRSVDRLIVVGRDMRELVGRRRGLTTVDDMIVIPNWATDDVLDGPPGERRTLLDELGLSDRVVLQFAGNIGPLQGIETLAGAAQIVAERAPQVHFLFIGSGGRKQWLQETVERLGLHNVTVLDHRPRSDQRVFLAACDVAVTAFVPGMCGAGVPSRLYNILASGKPIVAAVDADSEIGRVIREEDVGWVTPPGDVDAFVQAVIDAAADRERLARMAARARAAARAKYSRETAMKAYTAVFHTLLQEP